MRLVNVPLESVPERYSADWNRWFPSEYKRLSIDWRDCSPVDVHARNINDGEFLDVIGTNIFKTAQTLLIASLFHEDRIHDGDVFFFHDGWHPGAIHIKYMIDLLGIKAKMACYLHAGTYHDYDYLTWMGLGKWAEGFEESLGKLFDIIFVATHFHRDLLITRRGFEPSKIKVVGMPYLEHCKRFQSDGNIQIRRAVFPSRLAPDKGLDVWEAVQKIDPQFEWVTTYPKAKTSKNHFYHMLHTSLFAVSCSPMETFGIAMMEAVFAGCIPVVPANSAFKELYPAEFQYTGGATGLREKLRDMNASLAYYHRMVKDLRAQMIANSETAIERIVDELRCV